MDHNSDQEPNPAHTAKPTTKSRPKSAKPATTPVPGGLDVGYGFVKAVTPDGETVFPSLVAPIDNSDIMLPFYPHDELITVHGHRYLVGHSAARAAFRFREQWDGWWHSPAFTALLAKAKAVIPKGAYIVTGLPLHAYNSDNVKQIAASLANQLNVQSKVVAQGFGAYYHLATHNSRYGAAKLALIDIGSRTTELIAFSASHWIPQQCRGLVFGTQSLFAQLAETFSKQYGRKLDPYEIEHAVLEQTPLVIRTATLPPADLAKHLAPLLEDFLAHLHREMISLWGLANPDDPASIAPEFDYLVFTGGGALLLKELILTRYPHAVIPDQSQTSNAQGFFLLAQTLIHQAGGRS